MAVQVSVEMTGSVVKHRRHSAGVGLVEPFGWQPAGIAEAWRQSALAAEMVQIVWAETLVVEKQALEAQRE